MPCGLDFRKRFLSLLSYKFREFSSVTALSILEAANGGIKDKDGDKMKGMFDHDCKQNDQAFTNYFL